MPVNKIYWAKEFSTRFPTQRAGTVNSSSVFPLLALGLQPPDLPAGEAHSCLHWTLWKGCTNHGVPPRNGPFSDTLSPLPSNSRAMRGDPRLAKRRQRDVPCVKGLATSLCATVCRPADVAAREIMRELEPQTVPSPVPTRARTDNFSTAFLNLLSFILDP